MKQIGVKPVACKWDKNNFVTECHIVCPEDHPVLFWLSILRCLVLFVEHPLVFIDFVKVRHVHMVTGSDAQAKEEAQHELERPLRYLRLGA